jgi:hypothetical protein
VSVVPTVLYFHQETDEGNTFSQKKKKYASWSASREAQSSHQVVNIYEWL